MIITIDGPSASGKSTVARLVAQKLDIFYLSSGMLFRALAYALAHYYGYTAETIPSVTQEDLDQLRRKYTISYYYDSHGVMKLSINTVDITSLLKSPEIDRLASCIAVNPLVRDDLTRLQRTIAHKHSVVVEGRDTGSVIFPHADFKFFITASLPVRALRFQADQQKKGNSISLHQAIAELKARDERDSNRELAPLVIPHGAQVIDNSNLTVEQVVEKLLMLSTKKKSGTIPLWLQ